MWGGLGVYTNAAGATTNVQHLDPLNTAEGEIRIVMGRNGNGAGVALAVKFHDGFRATVTVLASRVGIATAILLLVGASAIASYNFGRPTRAPEATWVRLAALVACAIDLALVAAVVTAGSSSFPFAAAELRVSTMLADGLAPAVIAACAFAIAGQRHRPIVAVDRDSTEDERWDQLDHQ